ncbi:hypothetical protein [Microbacterium aurantiacum]
MTALTSQRKRRSLERRGTYWLFLIPIFIGFSVVVLAPFAMNVITSLFH